MNHDAAHCANYRGKMIRLSDCVRKNLCVDCDNPNCYGAGDKRADCPKYNCHNPKGALECDHCEFIDRYIKEMR